MSDWIILRTSGRFTLRLAETLSEDGIEAWTPVETRMLRIPNKNVRRPVRQAMLEGFVFARANRMIDLIEMSKLKPIPRPQSSKPADPKEAWMPFYPGFRLMMINGEFRAIGDETLTGLRSIEAKRTPKPKANVSFASGAMVRVSAEERNWSGKVGQVKRSNNNMTLVLIDGRKVNILTFLLSLDDILSHNIAAPLAA